jgi:hypothetical protein
MLWGPFYEGYMSDRRLYAAVPVVKAALITVVLLALFKQDPLSQVMTVCLLEVADCALIFTLEPYVELKDYLVALAMNIATCIVFTLPLAARNADEEGSAQGVSGTVILLLLLMVMLEMALLVYSIYGVVLALWSSCQAAKNKRKLEKLRQAKAEAKALEQMLEDMHKAFNLDDAEDSDEDKPEVIDLGSDGLETNKGRRTKTIES